MTIARVLARATINKVTLRSVRQASLSAEDVLFAESGPLGPDQTFPKWLFSDLGISAPDLTDDLKDVAIPFLAGEKTDKGAIDPLTGDPAEKGVLPGYFIGKFTYASSTAAVATSGRSLAAVVAELQASHTAGTLVAMFGGIIGFGDAAVLQAMGSVPTSYPALAQVIGYGDLDVLLAMGTTAPPANTKQWGVLVFGLGAWFEFSQIFGSDNGKGNASNTHDRVEIDVTARAGIDILVPGYPNWPFAETYIDFTNEHGRVFRLACILVRGALLDDHVNGIVNITANAIGVEDVGDGTGLPLMLARDIEHFWTENHLINQYSGGLYTDATNYPKWEDGTPKVRSSSYVALQAQDDASLGSPFIIAWYADKAKSTTECVGDWDRWTESNTGRNGHGQFFKYRFDPSVDITTWPIIEHVTDIFGPIQQVSGIERETAVVGSCDYDGDKEKMRVGAITRRSALGLARNKGREKKGDEIENGVLVDAAQLIWMLDLRLARLQYGMRFIDVPGKQGWLDYDVGEGVRLNSEEGYGALGYQLHPFVIWRRRFDFRTRITTFTLWDVAGYLP